VQIKVLTKHFPHALSIVSGSGVPTKKNYEIQKKSLTLSRSLLPWHPMDKSKWIEQLKQLAEDNYNKGYGYQVYVECYSLSDWQAFISDLNSWEETLDIFHTIANIRTEQNNSACNEVF
jgi:hypothetical protein